MADEIKISALPALPVSAQLTDIDPTVQSGVTYKRTNTQLINLLNSNIQLSSTSQVTGLITALNNKVTGPSSSTNNAIARYDTTTGKLVKDSKCTIDDSGNLYIDILSGVNGIMYISSGIINRINNDTQKILTYTSVGTPLPTSPGNGLSVATDGTLSLSGTLSGSAISTLGSVGAFTAQQYFAQQTLTDASPITWNLQTQQTAFVLLTSGIGATRQLQNPTNKVAGGTYYLIVKQSSSGSNALTFGTDYKWSSTPTLSTGANAVDIFTFICDGTNMYGTVQYNFQ